MLITPQVNNTGPSSFLEMFRSLIISWMKGLRNSVLLILIKLDGWKRKHTHTALSTSHILSSIHPDFIMFMLGDVKGNPLPRVVVL